MAECFRVETAKRLAALGIHKVYLPDYSKTKPNGPHIPILAPSPEVLKTRTRIIVIINDQNQDLGILAYRQLQFEKGLIGGSVAGFVKDVIQRSTFNHDSEQSFEDGASICNEDQAPGIVVLNPGQLLYSHKHNKAMNLRSWSAMPRKSCMHEMIKIHEEENGIAGHRTPVEHIKSVLTEVIYNSDRVSDDAEIYFIAIESGAQHMVEALGEDCELPQLHIFSLLTAFSYEVW